MNQSENKSKQYWWQQPSLSPGTTDRGDKTAVSGKDVCLLTTPKPGDACPYCHRGTLAYDGLFILTCDQCAAVAESGCFS